MVEGGKLLAIPYRGLAAGPEVNTTILDHMAANAPWFTTALTPEEIRTQVAAIMTDPKILKWELWNGGRFAGALLLHRVVPKIDAVFHFVILPNAQTKMTLFQSRRLLWNFLGYAFQTFGFERISMEVPEHETKYAHFLRHRLGFRYEGETDYTRFQKNKGLVRSDLPGSITYISAQGSRRDHAYWHAERKEWIDVVLLRLLRSEYEARASSGELPRQLLLTVNDSPQATRGTPEGDSTDAARLATGPIPAAATA